MDHLTRRQALATLGLGTLSVGCDGGGIGSVGCGIGPIGFSTEAAGADDASRGYLTARPRPSLPEVAPKAGSHHIGLGDGRDGRFYVPEGLTGQVPLVVLLHGAGGTADGIIRRLDAVGIARELKLAILAPDSRGRTWDMIRGQFGPDVAFLDRALAKLFAIVPIDPKRVAVGGFSDGASCAISLGLQNGDLFTHVAAFSPGFFVANQRRGRTLFYVSHGRQDQILPIDSTSRRVVPMLEQAGYSVRYKEFDGPHTVPEVIAREAFEWIAGRR
jgi:phospholipase/carboxylesterase